MISLESIKDYIAGLNHKEILRILSAYFVGFFALVVFLLYRHFDALSQAEQKMKLLNKARQEIQQIVTQYDSIKSKKAEVDDKLTKDKNFYLVKYYQDTIATINIKSQNSPSLSSGAGPAGYTEDSLQVNFTQITMRQLCEFLQALQATPRVSVKNLEISKGNDKKINVSFSLATLKPIVDTTTSVR